LEPLYQSRTPTLSDNQPIAHMSYIHITGACRPCTCSTRIVRACVAPKFLEPFYCFKSGSKIIA